MTAMQIATIQLDLSPVVVELDTPEMDTPVQVPGCVYRTVLASLSTIT